jgi:2-polyprenyl-6-hydroxyphenyl methylase/3-demethylubiquinone-9 3-methyltransferase
MSDATVTDPSNPSPTIRPHEAAHFGAQAAQWWDPKGSSAMLHKLNPVRLGFVRQAIDAQWAGDSRNRRPLAGKRALDVGCGAGLLCEPLARLGATVTGVDAAAESIAVARDHAQAMGFSSPGSVRPELVEGHQARPTRERASTGSARTEVGSISYLSGELASLNLGQFDLVTSMEVLEHVADKPAFLAQLAAQLAPGGLLILSTPNRTLASRALLVGAAEAVGAVPRGTHDWHDFVTPEELEALLADAGLAVTEMRGVAFSPLKGLHLSADMTLDIILAARHAATE